MRRRGLQGVESEGLAVSASVSAVRGQCVWVWVWVWDVPVDTVAQAVEDNQHGEQGEEASGLETGVCGEGFCAEGLLLRVALELDGGPVAGDAEEEGDDGDEVEEEREDALLLLAGGLDVEG